MLRTLLLLCIVVSLSCSTRVEYALREPALLTAATTVNINSADVSELERLPHVGRKTAESIVAFRSEHGRFRRTEQLMLIKGISEARYLEMRHLLRTK
jgi:competence protein ComEA